MIPSLLDSCLLVIVLGGPPRLKRSSGGVAVVAWVDLQILGTGPWHPSLLGARIAKFMYVEAHIPKRTDGN